MLLAAEAVNSCFKDAADYLSEKTVRGKANAMEPQNLKLFFFSELPGPGDLSFFPVLHAPSMV